MTTQQAMTDKRRSFLADVIVTAVEGGIDYWAYTRNYTFEYADNLKKDRDLAFASAEVRANDKPEWHELSPDVVEAGITELLAGTIKLHRSLRAILWTANMENDGGEIDSELADCIVQAALLGEIIYG